MTITITDPLLIEQLKAAGNDVVFADVNGDVIAKFDTEPLFAPPPEMMGRMLTEEQLAANRAEGPGVPLRKALAELKERMACTKS